METVSFLSDAFTLFLHLPKKKGVSGSRDGWYPGLITSFAPQSRMTLLNVQQVYPFVALQVLSERTIWRLVCPWCP